MNASVPSLHIQVVLFNTPLPEVDRLVRGVTAAARLARSQAVISSAVLALGDCSPAPLAKENLDAARQSAMGEFDELSYRHFGQNLGSAAGHNALFERCQSDLLFITNPDAYLSPDVFDPLVRCLGQPSVGMAEARQLPLEHPKRYDVVTGDTSWASGACVMMRSETFRELDGYDDDTFFLYCDDVDLSWRTRLAGYRVVHVPRARVFHDKRLSLEAVPETSAAEVYYSAEAALLMAWKYSRPDLVEKWSRDLLASGEAAHSQAVEAFSKRRRNGELPTQLDGDGAVATFVGREYSRSQFFYYD